MRTRMNVLAVLAIAGGAACGTDGPVADTTAPPVTTPAVVTTVAPTTTAAVDHSGELLTVADVGPAWRVGEPINEMDLASFAQLPCEDTGLNPTIAARLTAVAGIQFEPVDGSSKHMINMIVTGTPDRLAADLDVLFEALAQPCPAPSAITITPMTIPALGDQRIASTMTGKEAPDATVVWYVRSAIVRVGDVAVGVGLTEIVAASDPTPTITDAEFVTIVEAAVAAVAE